MYDTSYYSFNFSVFGGNNMEPGTKVIIRQNPHHPGAVDIVGTIASFRPGEGFGGAALVDICYRHPKTGKRQTMPLNSSCIEPVSPGALNELATRYETMALELRNLQAQLK
jgi:hypothetical protein